MKTIEAAERVYGKVGWLLPESKMRVYDSRDVWKWLDYEPQLNFNELIRVLSLNMEEGGIDSVENRVLEGLY